jgi:hypothetical protein
LAELSDGIGLVRLAGAPAGGALDLADSLFQQSPAFGFYTHAQIAYYAGAEDEALQWSLKAFFTDPLGERIAADPISLRESQRFQALESRLESILAEKRVKARQMICFDNPVADSWQPLPETCAGVARQ